MRRGRSKQLTNVVPFEINRAAPCDKGLPGASGQIEAIPLARNWKFLAFVTDGMRQEATPDAAEQFLIDHLDIEWVRLARLEIADTVKDRHCRDFARAAWRIFFYGDATEGAA